MKVFVYLAVMLLGHQGMTELRGDEEPGESNLKYAKGMILNLEENSTKGCGWVIKIDDDYFKPKNLSKAFHKDSLNVNLDYDLSLTMYKCSETDVRLQEILINWMEKE